MKKRSPAGRKHVSVQVINCTERDKHSKDLPELVAVSTVLPRICVSPDSLRLRMQ